MNVEDNNLPLYHSNEKWIYLKFVSALLFTDAI